MPPTVSVTIGSKELGLVPGGWTDLDFAIRQIGREHAALRVVAILNALALGREDVRSFNESYTRILPQPLRGALVSALEKHNAIFLEPWQQLTVLKRALVVSPTDKTGLAFLSEPGETAFFDACRFAADLVVSNTEFKDDAASKDPNAWIKIAAAFMPRLWMLNPPNPRASIGRFDVMFRQIPAHDAAVASRVAALDERFPAAMNGLTFTETTTLSNFLAIWSMRLKLAELFKDQSSLRLQPATFLKDTKMTAGTLDNFLARTAIDVEQGLEDDGGKVTPVVFRDRPLLKFSNGSVAPVYPPFLLEKLTSDIFWWLKDLNRDQQVQWQADWGYVAEAYVLRVLARAADAAACDFAPRLQTEQGELDGVLWMKGHVAVIEITSSSLRDAEGSSADWELLREGLRRAFVENPRGPIKEAILQLVRDVRIVLRGGLPSAVAIPNLQRIYPVMVATDRRIATPGVLQFLQGEFVACLTPEEKQRVAGLAVLSVPDVEDVESLVRLRQELRQGTPRGPLKILRRWDVGRSVAPSWWQFIEVEFGNVDLNHEVVHAYDTWRRSLPNYFTSPL